MLICYVIGIININKRITSLYLNVEFELLQLQPSSYIFDVSITVFYEVGI